MLRQAERKLDLLRRLACCFTDRRSPLLITHKLSEMLSQRIYGLALGYEDLNDHEQLRRDPLMAVLAGRRKLEDPLAGKSTLNRLEFSGGCRRYHQIDYSAEKIDVLLSDLFIESHAQEPEQIVLDLDATDIPLYGHQPERFFHGYYDSYCYLPLTSSPAINCYARGSGRRMWTAPRARSTRSSASWRNCAPSGRK